MSSRVDPWRSVRFLLEWDGLVQAGFSEVTVPDTSTDPIEYREGNEITTVQEDTRPNKVFKHCMQKRNYK